MYDDGSRSGRMHLGHVVVLTAATHRDQTLLKHQYFDKFMGHTHTCAYTCTPSTASSTGAAARRLVMMSRRVACVTGCWGCCAPRDSTACKRMRVLLVLACVNVLCAAGQHCLQENEGAACDSVC
eukprot:scaffold24265_cov19-Tisochrysis_lutea.AAC.4